MLMLLMTFLTWLKLTDPTVIGSDMDDGNDKPCEFSAVIRKK